MTALDSIILGIVEGFTEFLPVSSTGHLILASELLGIPSDEFLRSFLIAVQLGAILAVVALFWRRFLDIEVLKRLAVAFIPTGAAGFLLYPFIKGYLLGNSYIVVASLALGGIALILFERWHVEKEDAEGAPGAISYRQALLVGLAQSVAIVPGVSRSAATIVGGLIAGIRRVTIVEFSFLLAVPTMLAATGYDVLKSYDAILANGNPSLLATGFLASFAVALLSMRFLLSFVRRHSFVPFGIYRIAVAAAFFAFVIL